MFKMLAFDKEFYKHKIEKYNNLIGEIKIGEISIIKPEKNNLDGYTIENYIKENIKIIELKRNDELLMRISPHEVQGSYEAIKWVYGKVGVVGLGLGYFLQEILEKDNVEEIIVYEIDEKIINLYKQNFKQNKKVRIIKGDAFEANRENFDCFYVDIYNYKLSENVVEDYIKLNEIHNINEYSFWGVEHFLLSCSMEDLAWIYIPENWMTMARNLFGNLKDSRLLDNFKNADEKIVKDVLNKFKNIL